MKTRDRPTLFAAGIIERIDDQFLILRQRPAQSVGALSTPPWRFPRGGVEPGESAEAAMRRIAERDLGIHIEVLIGQPPHWVGSGPERMELRYFFCAVLDGEVAPGPLVEARWVAKGQLREYDFDECSQPVVEWLQQN